MRCPRTACGGRIRRTDWRTGTRSGPQPIRPSVGADVDGIRSWSARERRQRPRRVCCCSVRDIRGRPGADDDSSAPRKRLADWGDHRDDRRTAFAQPFGQPPRHSNRLRNCRRARAMHSRPLWSRSTPLIVDVLAPSIALEHASSDATAAAIANDAFAAEFHLEVAHDHMGDRGADRLRHAVIGNRPSRRTGKDATAIVFGAREAEDSLGTILRLLSERGVVMTKIGSFPIPGGAWRYGFFVEVEGHFTDCPLVVSFDEMKRAARFFRVLGSYQVT